MWIGSGLFHHQEMRKILKLAFVLVGLVGCPAASEEFKGNLLPLDNYFQNGSSTPSAEPKSKEQLILDRIQAQEEK